MWYLRYILTSVGKVDHRVFWEMLGFTECFEPVRTVCGRDGLLDWLDDSVKGDALFSCDRFDDSGKLRLSVVAEVGVLSSWPGSSSSSGIIGSTFFSSSSSSSPDGLDPLSTDEALDLESLRAAFVEEDVPG